MEGRRPALRLPAWRAAEAQELGFARNSLHAVIVGDGVHLAFRYLAIGLRGAAEEAIPHFPRPYHEPMRVITERSGNEPPPTLRDGTPIVVIEE